MGDEAHRPSPSLMSFRNLILSFLLLLHRVSAFSTVLPSSGTSCRPITRISSSSQHQSGELGGKFCVVTGANTGLGFETALYLAKKGAHVTLGCRSPDRGNTAASIICENIDVKRAGGSAHSMVLDLSSMESIEMFASNYCHPKLDVLINNAGIMAVPTRELSTNGLELHMAVNHFGHFLLTCRLMKKLSKSSRARVVTVASEAYRIASSGIRFDDINFKNMEDYNPWKAYGQSKLANILFARELQHRAKNAGLNMISMSLHPGVCRTELARYIIGPNVSSSATWATPFLAILALFLKTPEQGSQTQIYCATSVDIETIGAGQYFVDSSVRKLSPMAMDPVAAQRLWKLSESLMNCTYDLASEK